MNELMCSLIHMSLRCSRGKFFKCTFLSNPLPVFVGYFIAVSFLVGMHLCACLPACQGMNLNVRKIVN